MREAPVIGILAGGGSLPREIAEAVVERGGRVRIVAIKGEADEIGAGLPHVLVNWGAIGRIVRTFRDAGCRDLLIIGGVRRPDLWRLEPDLGFFLSLPALLRIVRSGGDDDVLRRVVSFFEGKGFRVVGPLDVAPGLVIGEGAFGRAAPESRHARDIALGFEIVRRLGTFDIGQGVIVEDGRLRGIEGVEGTDALLARAGTMRREAAQGGAMTRGGVLVKSPKPGQELRVDLPAIGPKTIDAVSSARLAGVAVLAGHVLAAERDRMRERADAAGVFVFGAAGAPPMRAAGSPPSFEEYRLDPIGGARLPADALRAAAKGAGVIEALRDNGAGRAVAVVGRHVLAVEAGEGVVATVERVMALRQWGRRKRRAGVVVLAPQTELTEALVASCDDARLAGIAVMGDDDAGRDAIGDAGRRGLFLGRLQTLDR